MRQEDLAYLLAFLELPLQNCHGVMDIFRTLKQGVFGGQDTYQYFYKKGERKDKVLLVAHADTFWHELHPRNIGCQFGPTKLKLKKRIISSANPLMDIGADDRAGCTIIWLLKDLGHSILITAGEENGQQACRYIMGNPVCSELAKELNEEHQFMIQFDRRNSHDFKCYKVGTPEFRQYVINETGYQEPDLESVTDIIWLCKKIPGVNLSIGYYNEHKPDEYLKIDEWENTLNLCRQWLSKDLPKFELPPQKR